MSALILEGKPIVEQICNEIRPRIEQFRKTRGVAPTLALVRVGNPPSAVRYAHALDRAFNKCSMGFQLDVLPDETTTKQLIDHLGGIARTKNTHGILLQHPLPPTIDLRTVLAAFPISKDVEGISPLNVGNLTLDIGELGPTSTPTAAIEILKYYAIPIESKHAVVVGRSDIVGKPLALMLLHANATVTICHSHTPNLADITRRAELLFVAIGKPHFITADMVAPGTVVIDFGINVHGETLTGDVDFNPVKEIAGAISPVPGGTGLVTAMLLLRNTLHAAERQASEVETQGRIKWLPILKSPRRKK